MDLNQGIVLSDLFFLFIKSKCKHVLILLSESHSFLLTGDWSGYVLTQAFPELAKSSVFQMLLQCMENWAYYFYYLVISAIIAHTAFKWTILFILLLFRICFSSQIRPQQRVILSILLLCWDQLNLLVHSYYQPHMAVLNTQNKSSQIEMSPVSKTCCSSKTQKEECKNVLLLDKLHSEMKIFWIQWLSEIVKIISLRL